jgi:hypothetical protein
MKIVTHCKLNDYDTIDERTDTSAYYSILASAREEPCHIADCDSEDEDVGVDDSEDEDVGVDNLAAEDDGVDDPEDEDVSADSSEDEYVSADDSKDEDVGADDSKDGDVGADNSAGENDPDLDSNTNQETIVINQEDTLAVSDAGHEGTKQTVGNIPSSNYDNHP